MLESSVNGLNDDTQFSTYLLLAHQKQQQQQMEEKQEEDETGGWKGKGGGEL